MAIKVSQLVNVLVQMAENTSTDEALAKMKAFLNRRNANHYWDQIKRELNTRIANDQHSDHVQVILGSESTKNLVSDKKANNYKIDPDLIAGFKIQDNDTLVDTSLSTQLINLKKTLTN